MPLRFLFQRANDYLKRPLWNAAYRLNNTRLAHRVLRDLSPTAAASRYVTSAQFTPRGWDGVGLALAQESPRHVDERLVAAAATIRHEVPCLGFGTAVLGEHSRWNRDYFTGHEWPHTAALRLDYVGLGNPSDVKVPWEINRLQFLSSLGQAWRLTGDGECLAEFQSLIDDWRTANPVGLGIAWSCPMEVSIRGINLIAAFELFWPELPDHYRILAYRLFGVHADFLRRHPELSDINGNHYLADMAGLVQLGLALRTLGTSPSWLGSAVEDLDDELAAQIHPDGVHHEHAINYHRLVAELVVGTVAYMRATDYPVPSNTESRAIAMLEFLAAVAQSDGHVPLIGDSDSGQVLVFGDRHPNDVSHLLEAGALLFDRKDLRPHRGTPPPEALWLTGSAYTKCWTAERKDERRHDPVLAFPDGGFAILSGDDAKVVTRYGEPGLKGRAAHDHADITAFTAELHGHALIVDMGTSTYTGSPAIRRREISATTHNALRLDGHELTDVRSGSVMDVVGSPISGRVLGWSTDANGASVAMTHGGFADLDGVNAYRRVLKLASDGLSASCDDYIEGCGLHYAEVFYIISPEWTVVGVTQRAVTLRRNGLSHATVGFGAEWKYVSTETSCVAPTYGGLIPAVGIRALTEVELPTRLTVAFEVVSYGERWVS